MAKIMIAGLPAAGKSTYIGALAYTLKECKSNMIYKLVELPRDISQIRSLYSSWLRQSAVDRTTRGSVSDITLRIQKDDRMIDLSLPDIAGEEFERMIQNQNDILKTWNTESDGLLFLIKDMPSEVLIESFESNNSNSITQQPTFEVTNISIQVKNLLLIKELNKKFNFKRIAIGLSAWDCKDEGFSPKDYLHKYFPVFHNYIDNFYPDAPIFGLSAQGAEYQKEKSEEIEEKTDNGTRAYIVKNQDKEYDLTIPIDYLIE